MITLGLVDLLLVLLFLLMVYLSFRGRSRGASILIGVLLLAILAECVAPGTFASIGQAIQGLNQVNAAGPHVQIQPIVRFTR